MTLSGAKLGDDGSPSSLPGHWRKLSSIQLFLERLVTRGLDKDPSVRESVEQLLTTVSQHKRVRNIAIKFCNTYMYTCILC